MSRLSRFKLYYEKTDFKMPRFEKKKLTKHQLKQRNKQRKELSQLAIKTTQIVVIVIVLVYVIIKTL